MFHNGYLINVLCDATTTVLVGDFLSAAGDMYLFESEDCRDHIQNSSNVLLYLKHGSQTI